MHKNSKIYIAGHRGLVGSAILNNLKSKGFNNLIVRTHKELDLTSQQEVADFFHTEKPEYVFLAAAKVGGIVANNKYRADFIYENLMIQNNVIHQAYIYKVKKLLFLGSTCIYPKNCLQPMKEEYLLTDTLEYTNEPYAIAKIAGIKMCESYNLQYSTNFIAAQPTNLYGPNDNFDLEKSHVLPALIRKIHLGNALENNDWPAIRKDLDKLPIEGVNGSSSEDDILNILAKYGVRQSSPNVILSDSRRVSSNRKQADSHFDPKGEISSKQENNKSKVEVEIWGSGKPMREFLWSEDMAEACVFLMENVDFKDIVENQRHSERSHSEVDESVKSKPKEGSQNVISNQLDRQAGAVKESFSSNVISNLSSSLKTGSVERSLLIDQETRNTHINIGTGKDISIKDLANTIKNIIGFEGNLSFNKNKPDGTLRKLTDSSKLHDLGWKHKVELEEGLELMYNWYLLI